MCFSLEFLGENAKDKTAEDPSIHFLLTYPSYCAGNPFTTNTENKTKHCSVNGALNIQTVWNGGGSSLSVIMVQMT